MLSKYLECKLKMSNFVKYQTEINVTLLDHCMRYQSKNEIFLWNSENLSQQCFNYSFLFLWTTCVNYTAFAIQSVPMTTPKSSSYIILYSNLYQRGWHRIYKLKPCSPNEIFSNLSCRFCNFFTSKHSLQDMAFPYYPKNLDIVWKPSTKTISVHFEIQILPNHAPKLIFGS